MARQPRIIYPGAYYHVMARGNQRQPIVLDDKDREIFLATFAEVVERTGWRVLAFVLLSNHYHWVIQTPQPNLVEGMKWFQNTYTRRFAVRHKAWGHLFGGRYKAILVDPEEERAGAQAEYLPALLDYIHLNPVRARLVKVEAGLSLLTYPWSSLALGYGRSPKQRVPWLAVEDGLALAGLPDTAAGRREFLRRLEDRARLEEPDRCGLTNANGQNLQSTLQRGWYWGRQSFGEALTKSLKTITNRTYRSSAIQKKNARLQAEELLASGLAHFKLEGADFTARATHPARTAIAWALARKTNVPQAWIAQKLSLHTPANVSQLTRRFEQKDPPAQNRREFKAWIKRVKIC